MKRLFLAALLGTTVFAPALARAAAGQVVFTLGPVEIERAGQKLVAGRGTPLEVGDTVTTGPTAFTQLRFKDGALLALRGGSNLKVEDFRSPSGVPSSAVAPPPAALNVASTEKSSGPTGEFLSGLTVLRLARGAFRTITGLIGKRRGDQYRIITPAATIGIRGTDYSAAYCEVGCGSSGPGLYVGVSYGLVNVGNDSGGLDLADNQYAYVKDNGTSPTQLLAPPEVLEMPIEQNGEGTQGETEGGDGMGNEDAGPLDESDDSGASAVIEIPQPEGTYELLPGEPGPVAFVIPGRTGGLKNGAHTDPSGGLIGFDDTPAVGIGTSHNANRGHDPATGLTWGRWDGGMTTGVVVDTTQQPVHWIYAFAPDTPVLPITSIPQTYDLIGNTDPTDNLGGKPGYLGSATFEADFVNQTVYSTLNIGGMNNNTEIWQASGSGSIAGSLFSGNYSNVTVNGVTATSGDFSGFFTNQAAGVGLSYQLVNGSTIVSGTAAFGNPRDVPQ